MKCLWEESDIKAGLLVYKGPSEDLLYNEETSYYRSTITLVGYDSDFPREERYRLIAFSDGNIMRVDGGSKKDIAKYFTYHEYVPLSKFNFIKMMRLT